MKLRKRIFATFLAAIMSISLLSVPVSAQGTGISETAKKEILSDAKEKAYWSDETAPGKTMNLGEFQVPAQENGEYTFQANLPENYLSGDTEVPGWPGFTFDTLINGFEVCAYAAVLDTDSDGYPLSNAEVQYYCVAVNEDSKIISGTIPVGETGSAVMILQQLQIAGAMEFAPVDSNKIILENADAEQIVEYQAKFQMSGTLTASMVIQRKNINAFNSGFHFVATITLPKSFVLDTQADSFKSSIFDFVSIVKGNESGKWEINFDLREDWDEDTEGEKLSDKDLKNKLQEPMTLNLFATIPADSITGNQNLVGSLYLHGDWDGRFSFNCESTAAIIRSVSAVTITPADMTIYMGGDGGYDAVVGKEEGQENGIVSTSLPHPLFKVTMPSDSTADPTNLTFTNGKEGEEAKEWKLVCANPNSTGTKYYYFQEGEGQDKVRVTYTDAEGNKHTSDSFNPSEEKDVFTTYTIELYPGENDIAAIKAKVDDTTEYAVSANAGTLTVRAVADNKPGDDPTIDVIDESRLTKVESGKAMAVAPVDTIYTLNDKGVPLSQEAQPSLLFDSIIEDSPESTDRTDALKAKVDKTLGAVATNATRHYEIKYLDLVDANNGNAWITSSAGTDKNTEFYVLHFKDLHRDGENSGFEIEDINECTVEKLTAENNFLEKTEQGIKFHVGAGGFSPFALVYDTVNTYTITATAGENGSLSPSGEFTVTAGADQTFTITPDRGYHIQDVLVDGASVGAVSSYTFADVAANHTIKATFAKDADPVIRYRIEASAGEGGSISPEGIVRVSQGGSQTFTITPDQGYKIEDVLVDGESVGPVSEYTFKNVRAWHTITVTFAKLPADPGDTGVSDWLDTEHHMAYLNGYPGQVFGPDRDMTRAEAAQMFYNLLLDKDVAGTASFTDVSADAWYAEAVNTLASLGMIQGVEGNRFQPDRAITRAEFTAIAMRFTHGETTGENRFSDVNPDQWFYDVVVGAVQYGWINGYEDGTFRPESTIKRAEVAAITNRMLARAADEAYVDAHASQLRLFADVAKDHWAYYTIVEASNTHDYQTNHGNETWKDA